MAVSKKLLSRFSTDLDMEENGAWVDFGEHEDGTKIRVKVRRIRSKKSQDVRKELEKPLLSKIRSGTVTDKEMEDLVYKQSAYALVADWEGILDDNDQPIPCTPANILEVFAELTDIRDVVIQKATEADTFRVQYETETLENLPDTSAGH